MLVRGSNGSYEYIDFRETAPAAAFQDMYVNNTNSSIYTGLASGVPGELRGLERLHQGYASWSWESLVMPAVKVARHGFPVTADLVRYMASATSGVDNFLVNDPTWAIDFAPNGTLLGLGDTITRRRYADTLEAIAKRGEIQHVLFSELGLTASRCGCFLHWTDSRGYNQHTQRHRRQHDS
jgi:gamma-glutamyltranspeptidase/glutathione hydrolase